MLLWRGRPSTTAAAGSGGLLRRPHSVLAVDRDPAGGGGCTARGWVHRIGQQAVARSPDDEGQVDLAGVVWQQALAGGYGVGGNRNAALNLLRW